MCILVCGRTVQEILLEQYGFMPHKGTRNAIFVLRRMSERAIWKKNDIIICMFY